MKTNTDKTNPHAKSISFDSHTNPVPKKTISSELVLLQAKYRIALKITSEEYG